MVAKTVRESDALALLLIGVALTITGSGRVAAQNANPYAEGLLQDVRALGKAVPGDLPTSIGYLSVQDDSTPDRMPSRARLT